MKQPTIAGLKRRALRLAWRKQKAQEQCEPATRVSYQRNGKTFWRAAPRAPDHELTSGSLAQRRRDAADRDKFCHFVTKTSGSDKKRQLTISTNLRAKPLIAKF